MTLDPKSWAPPVPIAHRGSRLLWPENTMEAFEGAVSIGYEHLETDLHITADGVLVCIHDATVDRTTDGTGRVAAMTHGELSKLDAGHRHGGADGFAHRGAGVQVPAFEDLVTAYPDIRLVVDLKADGMTEALARIIKIHRLEDRLVAGSFRDERLRDLRRATEGTVAVSTGAIETRMWALAARIGRKVPSDASALQVPLQMRGVRLVDERLVNLAHESGLHVHVWTVNSRSEMIRLLDMGVDGIVTDRVDILKGVLVERGKWTG